MSKIKVPAASGSGEGFLVLFAVSPRGGRGKEALWGLLPTGTNLTEEGSTLMTSSPPKGSPPNTITLGVTAQHTHLGDANIQSITLGLWLPI